MMDSTFTLLRRTTLVACLALAAFDTPAADKPRSASFGKGKANGPLLTRAELRECLALQERVRLLGEGVVTTQATLDKEKADIAQNGKALGEQLATLDRTSADAVNAYNASVQEHDKRIDAYNALTPTFNAKVEALQAGRAQFLRGCENRDFDEKDEIAIRKGQ
jgi:hypothetical protein